MRIIVKNLPESAGKLEIEQMFRKCGDITDVYMLEGKDGRFRRVCFVGYKSDEEAKEAQKYFHNTMFKNHKIHVELAKEEEKAVVRKTESQERRILYSKTIFVRGISSAVDRCALQTEFEKFGKLIEIKIDGSSEKKDGKSADKCTAVVRYWEGNHAVAAFQKVRVLLGMRVRVSAFNEPCGEKKKDYYNTLFFNFDTVIKRTCEIEKVDKRDLINLKDTALGSRIALLETNLVAQTKLFLDQNGINLDCIKDEKSKTRLILRNADILGALDLVQGEYKVNLAPSKCLAILDFKDEKEAMMAFRSLNMRRYKSQIVYCEFAPLCTPVEKPAEDATQLDVPKLKKTNKIIIKNIPFQASVAELKAIFSSYTHVVDIRLPVKSDKMHRGFGFIILDSPASVGKALEYFGASTHLYGRRLVLERAKL